MEVTLTDKNFDEEVIKSETPVIVDFWAEWCQPCKIIAPALTQIDEEYKGRIKIGKLNVDEFSQVAQTYLVRSIPNLKIFKNGKIVDEIIGAVPKGEIIKRLEKQL